MNRRSTVLLGRAFAGLFFGLVLAAACQAAEVMPPAPAHYFNDYAHVVSPGTASSLNEELEDFEKQTSSQIVVAIFPKLQSDSDVADYAVRVFRSWGVGQKKENNGAVLLVFVQDHKMFIATGYGLEGVLPDGVCKDIIDTKIAPHFKQGNFDAGITAGVEAMLAASRGEYKGSGTTVNERQQGQGQQTTGGFGFGSIIFLLFILFVFSRLFAGSRGTLYGGSGMSGFARGIVLGSLMGGGGGGGGFGGGGGGGFGGGGGGGGGGGFSGGGGSSGGGGAGGSW